MLYNDSAGGNTFYKFQRTEAFTRKVRALLYYFHTNNHSWINFKCPHVLIMHFYRLVWLRIGRCFRVSLFARVSESLHPVTYTRQLCANNTSQKIYRCRPAGSTRNYILLHNTEIIHRKIFCAGLSIAQENIFQDKTVTLFTATPTRASHVIIHFYIFHQVGSFFSWPKHKQVDST